MIFEAFQDAIVSADLLAVANHWNAVRGSQPMPAWKQLRPSAMAAQLSRTWCYKYDRQSGQFTGRLAGNRIEWGFGKTFRGCRLEQIFSPKTASLVQAAMGRIVLEPALYRNRGRLFRQGQYVIEGERIMLPLAEDGIHADGVLGVSAYDYPLANPAYGPVELLSDAEEWYSLVARSDTKLQTQT
jgi:hypothetical protein